MYWSNEEIKKNKIEIINNVPYLDSRNLPTPHSSAAVHATALALQTFLFRNRFEEARTIMKWLQTQRDTDSGFIYIQVEKEP